jgi:hypothetical protein
MTESIFGKNKDYISYSAWKLWQTNKNAYRKHYYEGEPSFETAETRFGSLLAQKIERGNPDIAHIPNYAAREYDMDIVIEGNRVVGRIDGFDEKRLRFLDHKTAHADRYGNSPWNKVKVRKLDQLPFYSMLIKEKYGKVCPWCHLVWVETEFTEKTVEFNGRTLYAQTRDLRLTGRVKKFRRYIHKYERKRIREELLKACEEIKLDYKNYVNSKRSEQVVFIPGQEKSLSQPTV